MRVSERDWEKNFKLQTSLKIKQIQKYEYSLKLLKLAKLKNKYCDYLVLILKRIKRTKNYWFNYLSIYYY